MAIKTSPTSVSEMGCRPDEPDRRFMPARFAEIVKENGSVGRKYRPSNQTDGDMFHAAYCRDCAKNTPDGCLIELTAHWSHIDDRDYPKEWVYGTDGHPTCTAHTKQVGTPVSAPSPSDKSINTNPETK